MGDFGLGVFGISAGLLSIDSFGGDESLNLGALEVGFCSDGFCDSFNHGLANVVFEDGLLDRGFDADVIGVLLHAEELADFVCALRTESSWDGDVGELGNFSVTLSDENEIEGAEILANNASAD